ncbi:MAG: hypothetical protein ACO3UU_01970, partial [Minisyncoccia bacterium]
RSLMEIQEDLKNWIEKISQLRPDLGGFSICPYAKQAKYKILEANVENLEVEDGYDVIIFVIDIRLSLEEVQKWCDLYNRKYSEWKFFEDCASYNTFINGIQTNNGKYNLILAQPKAKLRKFREILAKTNYYDYWSNEYLQEILEEDYNLLDKG